MENYQQIMEIKDNQWLIDLIESLKEVGEIYNDADFCKKTGLNKTFVSDMKAGRVQISEQTVHKIMNTFPASFGISSTIEEKYTCAMCEEKDKRIAFMEKYIERLEDENTRLRSQLGISEVKKVG